MESLVANIFVKDIDKTMAFYNTLGFEKIMSVPESGELNWVMMKAGEVTIMFQTFKSLENSLPDIHRTDGGSLLFYIRISGIRKFFAGLEKKVTVLAGLEKTFYGATEFSIKDNNEYVLTFAEDEK